jgi:oxalate decarboxylase
MSDIENDEKKISRRGIVGLGSAAVAAATLTMVGERSAEAQQRASHTAANEINPGQQNGPLAAENPDSEWPPPTDNGSVKPFKYSFSLSRASVSRAAGGHGRSQFAILPISKASRSAGCRRADGK